MPFQAFRCGRASLDADISPGLECCVAVDRDHDLAASANVNASQRTLSWRFDTAVRRSDKEITIMGESAWAKVLRRGE